MGNSSSDLDYESDNLEYEQVMQQYNTIRQMQNSKMGDSVLLGNIRNPSSFAIQRKLVTNNEEHYNYLFDNAKFRKDMRHKHICRTLGYLREKENNFCSTTFQVKILLEMSDYSFLDEIEQRNISRVHFMERELFVIICEVVSALNYYAQFAIVHNNIRLDSIYICKQSYYDFDNYQSNGPQDVTINNDIEYYTKLQDPLLFHPENNYNLALINLHSENSFNYLSPILTEALGQGEVNPVHDVQKSDLFTLGMCILHAGLLDNNNDCYDYMQGQFFEESLFNKLDKLKEIYSQNFVELVEQMLQVQEIDRPSTQDFYENLKRVDHLFEKVNKSSYSHVQQQQPITLQQSPYQEPENQVIEEHVKHAAHIPNHHEHQQQLEYQIQPQQQYVSNMVEGHALQQDQPDKSSSNHNVPSPNNYFNKTIPDETGDHEIAEMTIGGNTNRQSYNPQMQPTSENKTYSVGGYNYQINNNQVTYLNGGLPEQSQEHLKHAARHVHNNNNTNDLQQVNVQTYDNHRSNETRKSQIIKLEDPRNPYYSQYQTRLSQNASPQQNQLSASYENVESLKHAHAKHTISRDTTPLKQSQQQQSNGNTIAINDPRNPFYQSHQDELRKSQQFQQPAPITSQSQSQYVAYQPPQQQQQQTYQVKQYAPPTQTYAYNIPQQLQKSNNPSFLTKNLNDTSQLNQDQGKYLIQDAQGQKSNLNQVQKKFVSETYQDQSKFEGEKEYGKRHGYGKFHYPMGGWYEGNWEQDKMEGTGKLFDTRGQLNYDGQFVDDMFDGIGILYNDNPTKDGRQPNVHDLNTENRWIRFEGTFKQDCKQGWGAIHFSDGTTFEGQFANDMAHGHGTYLVNGISELKGRWEFGKFVSEF